MPWPTRVIDRESSWAILVGASEYLDSTLEGIPQAETSVSDLRRALTGTTGLFCEEHVVTVTNPKSTDEILGPLDQIAGQQPDVVLFYYVGHGMQESLDGGGHGLMELFLTLHGSVDKGADRIRTGVPGNAVFSRLRSLRAKQSVVVLDCCFAGRALEDRSAGDVHILCATGKTTRARYGLTDRHTGFTGALLQLFERGIPDGPQHLDLNTVFHYLSVILPTTAADASGGRLPRPRQRATDHSGNLAFVRNPAFGTARTPEGIAARAEFARRVADRGSVQTLPAGEQRMLLAHATELFASIAADSMGLAPDSEGHRSASAT
ncbi:caspase, EACC1-associated type [Streptomyces sp. GQFP]|uniref:caspase, EACC1-associated type n=1 Tax=Streptomyces sp. GQFP TaxID=2907545 RepID=UPI0022860A3A